MRVPTTLPRGLLTRLRKSRKRLDVLDRQVIVTAERAETLASDAVTLAHDLEEIVAKLPGNQRAAVEPMVGHARALERRFTEASAPLYDKGN